MKSKFLALLGLFGALALGSQASLAQRPPPPVAPNSADNPDWVEQAIETPPPFSTKHLVPIDLPVYASTKAGFDPDTLVVGDDGVVRYVMVMTNASGNVNAVYEGIRCATSEVKTYARFGSSGKWSMLQNPAWKGVGDNMPSHHAQAFARQGACLNYMTTSKKEVLDALKAGQRPAQSEGNYRE